MITTKALLAAVREKQGITSNYRLARFLDVPEKSVQRWNTGSNVPKDDMVLKLAELAGVDPAEALTSAYAQRTTDDTLRRIWTTVAERVHDSAHGALGVFVGGAAIVTALFVASPDASATALTRPADEAAGVCILCQLIRAWLRRSARDIGRALPNLTPRSGALRALAA